MTRILLVNDDGIKAHGIRALYEVAKEFGEIVIVAPLEQQSATSHSITIEKPLVYEKVDFDGKVVAAYAVNGTPVDCVKIALNIILEAKPDIVLSGINWGANLGASVIYSGTVGAALEASFHDLPAIAFSLKSEKKEDYTFAQKVVREILRTFKMNESFHPGVLNVNIPYIKEKDFKGYRVTHQTNSSWHEEYIIKTSNTGERFHVLSGELLPISDDKNGDILALTNNYVSITPITPDFTDYKSLEKLKEVF
ncbi:MAG: 5'/3'-nucleotidase SurE [Candidatus Margulisiibacteriota bacterium]|nr:MAG: 5'/3'-nucleotidase SurE [Candidatus Margulisbacteria bacterium GWD2_39_127]OGI04660.1 MAG: 5'/3'-nucleotidase SurE [Candidatus Margulisbacteria bacterium GWF2_38_17]OGI11808.1 MAG: 5'/3'-nucleotidase SurE [Candidatus Margulisbacteria bacterium GWE2_39_32]PZM79822.1 MAG: 5'/3'-nucleotidase SurE [Candidatus Margulisiibacteriota bacterium]HAR62730.1 5'/3'-nucleotidase SurE [Candidatus Margulisiibacteriota bacterium]